MSLKSILLCKEKHEDCYWDASTEEAWAKSSLTILTERWNRGYWYELPEEPSSSKFLSQEQIDSLPEGSVKELALKEAEHHKFLLRHFREEKAWYDCAKSIVEQQDLSFVEHKNKSTGKLIRRYPRAYGVLIERNKYEYEEIRLVDVLG